VPWTPPLWLRKLDLVRDECRQDPAFGLPPEEKLERIALLLLRRQAAAAHRLAQRDYDFSDAVSIIEEQKGRLDEECLDLWARRLYVEQELAYVMRGGTVG